MKNTRSIATNALLVAVLIIMSVVPFLGFIQVGPVAITLSHIPVIIGAIILGPSSGFILGLTFGLGSWYAAITRAASPIDLLFTNPLVAIVPRVLFGLFVAYLWKFINTRTKNNSASKVTFTVFTSTLFHTAAVLSAIYLAIRFGNNSDLLGVINGGILVFIISAVGVNVLLECLVAVFVTAGILSALRFIKKPQKPAFIPRPLVSANQAVIILSVLLTWLFKIPYILLIPMIFGLLGVLFNDNPVMSIGKRFLKKPLDSYHREDPDAQRFSQIIAIVLLTISFIAFLFRLDLVGYIASAMVVVAATVAILGFCVGCYIFYQISLIKQKRNKKAE